MPKEVRILDRETPDTTTATKKRRVTKTVVAEPPPVIAPIDVDLYNSVVEYEEEESVKRDAETDAQHFYKTCEGIRGLLFEISELKLKKPAGYLQKIKEKRISASLKMLTLKKLNRLEKFRTRQSRDLLQKAREQVDSDHLHLQNLLYESLHLNREVQKCMEFKSKDEDLQLVSIDEFYEKAPENITKPEITKTNSHELKLARLQWELQQRKELAEECKQLQTNNEKVSKEIEQKKDRLNNLLPALKSIMEATKSLQENLGINFDKDQKIQEAACLLPKALYVLFVQANAFSKVAKWVNVSIVGECDKTVLEESPLDDISSADSDSDNELDSSHRRKTTFQDRRSSAVKAQPDRTEQRKRDCLKKHPLSILVKLTLKTGECVSIEFQWLTQLEIVCVLPTLNISNIRNITSTDMLSSRLILTSLHAGDTGEESPNPATHFQLHRAGMTRFPTNVTSLGIPYKWVQKVSGLLFMNSSPEVSIDLCRNNLEATLKLIRKRCTNRLALSREMYTIERDNVEYPLRAGQRKINIRSLVIITMQDFEQFPGAKHVLDEQIINESYMFYKVQIESFSAKVFCYIAVSPDYPAVKPIVLLQISFKGIHTGVTCEDVRDIEREVNVHPVEPDCGLLTSQMIKILICLEIYFQIKYPQDFPTVSNFFSTRQARTRGLPLKYNKSAGGIFTHR